MPLHTTAFRRSIESTHLSTPHSSGDVDGHIYRRVIVIHYSTVLSFSAENKSDAICLSAKAACSLGQQAGRQARQAGAAANLTVCRGRIGAEHEKRA
eukprot:IDg19688t1